MRSLQLDAINSVISDVIRTWDTLHPSRRSIHAHPRLMQLSGQSLARHGLAQRTVVGRSRPRVTPQRQRCLHTPGKHKRNTCRLQGPGHIVADACSTPAPTSGASGEAQRRRYLPGPHARPVGACMVPAAAPAARRRSMYAAPVHAGRPPPATTASWPAKFGSVHLLRDSLGRTIRARITYRNPARIGDACSCDACSRPRPPSVPGWASQRGAPHALLPVHSTTHARWGPWGGGYMKRKRATSLRLMMPSTLEVSGCTTITRRTLGMLSRSSTTRNWSCLVHT